MTLLVGQQEGHLACKKTEWWGAGVVVCLERRADLHMAQLMPLPLTISCFSKIQIGFTFLVPAHLGNPGKRAIKRVCVCRIVRKPICFSVCCIDMIFVTDMIHDCSDCRFFADACCHCLFCFGINSCNAVNFRPLYSTAMSM